MLVSQYNGCNCWVRPFFVWDHDANLWLAPYIRHFMAGTIYQTLYGWHHISDTLWLAPYIRHFMAGTLQL